MNFNHDTHFPLISVKGNSFEMGYQHGSQAKILIHKYLDWIEDLTGKKRDLLCRNAMIFAPLIKNLSPLLFDEIEGLAKGASISFEEAVLCQARAEASKISEGGCTAFAVTGSATESGFPLAGQNQDLESGYSDVAILLHVKPTDGRPRALMFTFAGQLGYSGLNEYGVAHFANALYGFRWQRGLPHYPLKRIMLEKTSTEECVKLLTENRTCSAANIIICDRKGKLADLEVMPEKISAPRFDSKDIKLHTNHYLSKDFLRYEENTLPDSSNRLERMKFLVNQYSGTISVNTLKTILADHQEKETSICRHGGSNLHSISGYIAEPEKSILHVRKGYGCSGEWQEYEV